jgi:hypothetical protein
MGCLPLFYVFSVTSKLIAAERVTILQCVLTPYLATLAAGARYDVDASSPRVWFPAGPAPSTRVSDPGAFGYVVPESD